MKKKLLITLLSFIGSYQFAIAQSDTRSYGKYLKSVEEYINQNKLTRKGAKRIFNDVKNLASKNNADALCMLGVLHKDGIGTPLNFNKARHYFQLAHKLGSEKAAYSLGYLYLKGLGNIDQDYSKALKWFSISDYPMAKHWIAKMHYLGLGVPQDQSKAIAILRDNSIYNSRAFLWDIQNRPKEKSVKNETKNFKEFERHAKTSFELKSSGNKKVKNQKEIFGNWSGFFLELDWSGKQIMRTIPIEFSAESKDDFGTVYSKITIDSVSTITDAIWLGNTLNLFDCNVEIKKQYTDHLNHRTLNYDFTSISFKKQIIDDSIYLIGQLESHVTQWKEPGPPTILVLSKVNKELSAEVLEAFAQQEDSFIKVYPNPFVNDLLVYYELDKTAQVTVTMYDYYGKTSPLQIPQGFQKAGKQTFTLNNLSLTAGIYVLKIQVNEKSYSKLVIKK